MRRRRIELARAGSRGCDGNWSDPQTDQRWACCIPAFEAFASAVGRMRTVAECLRVSDKRPLLHDSVSACSVAFPRVRMPAGSALVKCRLAFESILCGYARRRRDLYSCMKMWCIALKPRRPAAQIRGCGGRTRTCSVRCTLELGGESPRPALGRDRLHDHRASRIFGTPRQSNLPGVLAITGSQA